MAHSYTASSLASVMGDHSRDLITSLTRQVLPDSGFAYNRWSCLVQLLFDNEFALPCLINIGSLIMSLPVTDSLV
jgi:hypothetical protein